MVKTFAEGHVLTPGFGSLDDDGRLCVVVKICIISPENESLIVTTLSQPVLITVTLCVTYSLRRVDENMVLVATELSAGAGRF